MQPPEPADVRSMAEVWISGDHVAAHLGVSIDSIYRWIVVDASVRADCVNTSSRQD